MHGERGMHGRGVHGWGASVMGGMHGRRWGVVCMPPPHPSMRYSWSMHG